MAKPFFEEDWEKLTKEELSRARSKLSGFIEGIPEKDKVLREVRSKNSSANKTLKPDGQNIIKPDGQNNLSQTGKEGPDGQNLK